MSSFAVSALVRRRSEIACEINERLSDVDRLTLDVKAIDHVLGLLQPELDTEAIPALQFRPRPDWAKPGQVARMVYEALRESGKPMNTGELTDYIARTRGIENDAINRKRVYKTLDRMRMRKTIVTSHEFGRLHWDVPRSNSA